MPEPFDTYLRDIAADVARGVATEHTYRPHLKRLLESVATSITATNEPRRSECGAPDFVITRGAGASALVVGHVEAKDIGLDLAVAQESEQLQRYRSALGNLVLTDYLEFRWFRNGDLAGQPARLARLEGGRLRSSDADAAATSTLLETFLGRAPERISSPRNLAERMARLAHLIRDVVVAAFDLDRTTDTLSDLLTAFRQVLLPDLTINDFADMYSQTLAYGLFAARIAL